MYTAQVSSGVLPFICLLVKKGSMMIYSIYKSPRHIVTLCSSRCLHIPALELKRIVYGKRAASSMTTPHPVTIICMVFHRIINLLAILNIIYFPQNSNCRSICAVPLSCHRKSAVGTRRSQPRPLTNSSLSIAFVNASLLVPSAPSSMQHPSRVILFLSHSPFPPAKIVSIWSSGTHFS